MEFIREMKTFQDLINGEEPVIVKFSANWCPDCKRMDMFIGDIVEEYNAYKWFEINNDELPDVAQEYEVMGIPSILVFQNGQKIAHLHSADAKTPEEVQGFLASTFK